ncbi:hypothetical protein [Yoonia sp.]|uniref:hypothetical protein n=1 Tax=Yoonia sp. TaxID=2212373 RepID=UPI0025DFC2B6|nr:hypothetical protein [Yoonia sp.]
MAQLDPRNLFTNVGRPAFSKGGSTAKKSWALITTIGFGIFWFAGLFAAAELFGQRDMTVWPMILTPVGLIVGMVGRVMMVREQA